MKPTYEQLEQQVLEQAVQLANAESKCRELAAENAALKVKGRELLKEAAYVYSQYNRMVDHLDGESIDGQTLHEFQAVIEAETTATDAFLAEVRAQGVEMAACALDDVNQFNYANMLDDLAQKLRKDSNTADPLAAGIITEVGE